MFSPRLFVAVVLSVSAAPAFAQAPPLQHFQCYAVSAGLKNPPQQSIRLTDQFGPTEEVRAGEAVRFCNPADKFHRNTFVPITDVRQHVTFYTTHPQTAPVRYVTLSNQFDPAGASQTWFLGEPVAVAVPTQKPPHAFDDQMDAYRCYRAQGNQVFETVALNDQFLPWSLRFVLYPVLFCNPAHMVRLSGGQITPIRHPDTHMACYWTTRATHSTPVMSVFTRLSAETFAFRPVDMMCVPTAKLAWGVIPDDPFGPPASPTGGSAVFEW